MRHGGLPIRSGAFGPFLDVVGCVRPLPCELGVVEFIMVRSVHSSTAGGSFWSVRTIFRTPRRFSVLIGSIHMFPGGHRVRSGAFV